MTLPSEPEDSFPDLVAKLRLDAEVPVSESFDAAVWNGIHQARISQRRYRSLLGAAAAAVLLLGVQMRLYAPRPQTAAFAAASRASEWLAERQAEDGSWAPELQGGDARYRPGVSGLALLALLHAPEGQHVERAHRAAEFLSRWLPGDSREPDANADCYNRLLALRALLEHHARYPTPDGRDLLTREFARLARSQDPDGGWGYQLRPVLQYQSAGRTPTAAAVTYWVCTLLREARNQGIPLHPGALPRAERWLAGNLPRTIDARTAMAWMARLALPEGEGHAAELGARDFYRDMLAAAWLQRHQPESWETLRQGLVGLQDRNGSWNQRDPWTGAGGRVYATASAILVLAPSS